jgi:hypothetical protein
MYSVAHKTLKNKILWWAETIIAFIFILLIMRYQYHLLSYLEWGDESATIVTAKLMAAGDKLFSEIHELHGPLTFLPGLFIEYFGEFGVKAHRIPIAILQWMALIAIYFSPLLQSRSIKFIYCLICATVMMIYLPDLFGHTYIFQVIAGLFFIIILSQYTLPAILKPDSINNKRIILGNFLIFCLPFLAFTYIPISIALFICSYLSKFKKIIITSALAGIICNIFFLIIYGSIPGFIALHFWINLAVSRQFVEGEALGIRYIALTMLGSITNDLSRFIIFIGLSASIINLANSEKKIPFRSALLGLGIASLLVRSLGFQALPLYYLALAMPLIFLKECGPSIRIFLLSLPIYAACFIKLVLLNPANIPERQTPTSSKFSELASLLTTKDDKVIAWPFRNHEYILADRLPASGNFFYLPWQVVFYKNPLFGLTINSCDDIILNTPKLIALDKYPFAGIKWENYAEPCIADLIAERYKMIPDTAFYVRNDIYIANPWLKTWALPTKE